MDGVVIIPTYNERDNIAALVKRILALPLDLHVIIVDDNSPDGTGYIVKQLATENEEVHAIYRPGKLGLGSAYIAGFKLGLDLGAERLLTMDADFSHNPAYIPDLINLATHYHITIGSRYMVGGGVENWGLHRRLLSLGANTFARSLLGLHVSDCTAGFRCYHHEVLLNIDLDQIFSNGYSFLVEMLFECQRKGFLIGETPIVFIDREQGASKISGREIFKAINTVLRLAAIRAKPNQDASASLLPGEAGPLVKTTK